MLQVTGLQVAYGAIRALEEAVLASAGIGDEIGPEEPAEDLLGDVIVGGSEAARDQDDIVVAHALGEGGKDLVGAVTDREHPAHRDADAVEVLGDRGGVGVHHLADEELIADGDDGAEGLSRWHAQR